MRRALTILLVALGGFLTAFIGGSTVAGALELPGSGLVEHVTSSVSQNQSGSVANETDQDSEATVDNQQSNRNTPISILSPSSGDNRVEQGNVADNDADSGNVNGTDQALAQDQAGTATTTDDSTTSNGWMDRWNNGNGGSDLVAELTQTQKGEMANETGQDSEATVDNQQSNVYVPISILSPSSGDNRVEQGNVADNDADSGNVNGTDQALTQDQAGTATTTDDSTTSNGWMDRWNNGNGGSDLVAELTQTQKGDVANETDQDSEATVDNQQSNVYVPISILSPSSGDNRVEQGNAANNDADSGNVNGTDQALTQDQAGTATTTDDSTTWMDRWAEWGHDGHHGHDGHDGHDGGQWKDDCDR